MAATATTPASPPSDARPRFPARSAAWLLEPLLARRNHAAAAELRESRMLARETALVHGPLRWIGLAQAGLLPFND